MIVVGGKCFAVYLADIEPPVIDNEINDFIQLFIQMRAVIRNDGYPDDRQFCVVVSADFGYRGVEAAAQTSHEALDDASFAFQRADAMQVDVYC